MIWISHYSGMNYALQIYILKLWSQHIKMWVHLEIGLPQKGLRERRQMECTQFQSDWCLYRKGNLDTPKTERHQECVCSRKRSCEDMSRQPLIFIPGRKAFGRNQTWHLDFWSWFPYSRTLREFLLFKSSHLWYFVMATLANECTYFVLESVI